MKFAWGCLRRKNPSFGRRKILLWPLSSFRLTIGRETASRGEGLRVGVGRREVGGCR